MKNERTLERIHWPVFLLSFISPTVYYLGLVVFIRLTHSHSQSKNRLGDEDRRLMHLVPAPAVRLMKRRVLSRPGVNRVPPFALNCCVQFSSFPSLTIDSLSYQSLRLSVGGRVKGLNTTTRTKGW